LIIRQYARVGIHFPENRKRSTFNFQRSTFNDLLHSTLNARHAVALRRPVERWTFAAKS